MQNTVILNQNKAFVSLYQHGKAIVSPYVVIYVRKNRRTYNRFGVTAGKKVGNSVARNRAKRIIRQAYRENVDKLPVGMDLVIVARAAIGGISSTQLSSYLGSAGRKRIEVALQAGEKK